MRILFIIILMALLTGCAQFAPQSKVILDDCTEHFKWDNELRASVVHTRHCTKSSYTGNKEASNVKVSRNGKTGDFKFSADAVSNPEETEIAKAWAKKVKDLENLQNTISELLESAKKIL